MTKLKAIELFSHLFTPLFPTLSSIHSLLHSSSQSNTNPFMDHQSIEDVITTITSFLQHLTIQQQYLLLFIFTSIPIYEYSTFDDFAKLHSLLMHLPLIDIPSGIIPLLCLKGVYRMEKKYLQTGDSNANNNNNEMHERESGEEMCLSENRVIEVLQSEGMDPNKEGYDECRNDYYYIINMIIIMNNLIMNAIVIMI